MTKIFDFVAALILSAALVGVIFLESSESIARLVLFLLIMTVPTSFVIAFNWYSAIRDINVEGPATVDKIRSRLRLINRWLQLFLPKTEHIPLFRWESIDINTLITKLFLLPIFIGIVALAVGGVLAIVMHQSASRGIFGAVLEFRLGKAVALGFLLYLLVTSLTVIFVGLIGKFFKWKSK